MSLQLDKRHSYLLAHQALKEYHSCAALLVVAKRQVKADYNDCHLEELGSLKVECCEQLQPILL